MPDIDAALRRIVTGDDRNGRSVVILDGPPSATNGDPRLGGLFEIWHDVVAGALDPRDRQDLGSARSVLSPDAGHVKVRWFVINPPPPDVSRDALNAAARQRFASFDAEDHLTDQDRHPAMHRTESLDVICLLQGDVTLVLDDSEHRLKPGQVVIQRGTSHGWTAHGGPALLLAVLVHRPLTGHG